MAKLPFRDTTKFYLDNKISTPEYGRGYLGMSSIGEECARKLWYGFHFASKRKFKNRTKRIFSVGHLFEEIAIKELKSIGCEVYKIENGKKVELTGAYDEDQETLMGFFGHVSGHSDGRIKGVIEFPNLEMLLELKTMKDDKFNAVKKKGVVEAFPIYYAQTQRYMSEKKLTKTFFLAINKNTCEYHVEFIDSDPAFAKELKRKESEIIMSDRPPAKAYPEGYWKCFNCDNKNVCHNGYDPELNCRTCKFVDIAPKGEWHCSNKDHNRDKKYFKDDYVLTLEEQKLGCKFYKKGWNL